MYVYNDLFRKQNKKLIKVVFKIAKLPAWVHIEMKRRKKNIAAGHFPTSRQVILERSNRFATMENVNYLFIASHYLLHYFNYSYNEVYTTILYISLLNTNLYSSLQKNKNTKNASDKNPAA